MTIDLQIAIIEKIKKIKHPLGLALGSPIFPSGCEGKLDVVLEPLHPVENRV